MSASDDLRRVLANMTVGFGPVDDGLPTARRVGWRRLLDVDWHKVLRIIGTVAAMGFVFTVIMGIGLWPIGFPPTIFFVVLGANAAIATGAFIWLVVGEENR